MFDYHVHTKYSNDSCGEPIEFIEAAVKAGLKELCFTEHCDFDEGIMYGPPVDMECYSKALRPFMPEYKGVKIRLGVEVGLKDEASAKRAWEYILPYEPDFIIGSVHYAGGKDAYDAAFFEGLTKAEAYYKYINEVNTRIKSFSHFNVLGHIDYAAKFAHYADRAMKLEFAPDIFDDIFRCLIENGRGMEINTSVYRTSADIMWGSDLLNRYAQLGGEYVTIGTDSHGPQRVGFRVAEAIELARSAGIKYIAAFEKQAPILYKI